MMRTLIILNAGMLALILAGGARLRNDWVRFELDHQVENIQPAGAGTVRAGQTALSMVTATNWKSVAERNIFSFDRNDIAVVPVVATAARPNRPKPFLFGTMSLGGSRMAMLGPGDAGNRSYRPMVVGDVIDGWKVIEVNEKTAVVESGGVQETILMNDPTAQIPRDYNRTLAGAQNPVLPAPVARAPEPEQPRVPVVQPQVDAPAPAPAAGAPGTRIIRTPFGDKVVPVP